MLQRGARSKGQRAVGTKRQTKLFCASAPRALRAATSLHASHKPSCKPQVSNAASFIRCPLRPAAHRKFYNYGSEFTRPAPELTNRARTLHACVVDIKPRGAKMKQCCNRQIEGSNWYILRLGVVRSVSRRTKAPSRVTIIGDSSANNSSYKLQYCTHATWKSADSSEKTRFKTPVGISI